MSTVSEYTKSETSDGLITQGTKGHTNLPSKSLDDTHLDEDNHIDETNQTPIVASPVKNKRNIKEYQFYEHLETIDQEQQLNSTAFQGYEWACKRSTKTSIGYNQWYFCKQGSRKKGEECPLN